MKVSIKIGDEKYIAIPERIVKDKRLSLEEKGAIVTFFVEGAEQTDDVAYHDVLQSLSEKGIDLSGDSNYKKVRKRERKQFEPPTYDQVLAYANERDCEYLAKPFFNYFDAGNWVDSTGKKVVNWKQKFITWQERNKHKHRKNNQSLVNGNDYNFFGE